MKRLRQIETVTCIVLFATMWSTSAVSPKLNSIFPAGGQRGTELDLCFNVTTAFL